MDEPMPHPTPEEERRLQALIQRVHDVVRREPVWMVTIALGTVLGNMLGAAPSERESEAFIDNLTRSVREQAATARRERARGTH